MTDESKSEFLNPTGTELIAAERLRQIEKEGWTTAHDDEHASGELVRAAVVYATPNEERDYYPPHVMGVGSAPKSWPWSGVWWKPTPTERIRELVKAGALIAAEIDRLQRKRSRR